MDQRARRAKRRAGDGPLEAVAYIEEAIRQGMVFPEHVWFLARLHDPAAVAWADHVKRYVPPAFMFQPTPGENTARTLGDLGPIATAILCWSVCDRLLAIEEQAQYGLQSLRSAVDGQRFRLQALGLARMWIEDGLGESHPARGDYAREWLSLVAAERAGGGELLRAAPRRFVPYDALLGAVRNAELYPDPSRTDSYLLWWYQSGQRCLANANVAAREAFFVSGHGRESAAAAGDSLRQACRWTFGRWAFAAAPQRFRLPVEIPVED